MTTPDEPLDNPEDAHVRLLVRRDGEFYLYRPGLDQDGDPRDPVRVERGDQGPLFPSCPWSSATVCSRVADEAVVYREDHGVWTAWYDRVPGADDQFVALVGTWPGLRQPASIIKESLRGLFGSRWGRPPGGAPRPWRYVTQEDGHDRPAIYRDLGDGCGETCAEFEGEPDQALVSDMVELMNFRASADVVAPGGDAAPGGLTEYDRGILETLLVVLDEMGDDRWEGADLGEHLWIAFREALRTSPNRVSYDRGSWDKLGALDENNGGLVQFTAGDLWNVFIRVAAGLRDHVMKQSGLSLGERTELDSLRAKDALCSSGDRPMSPPVRDIRRQMELEERERHSLRTAPVVDEEGEYSRYLRLLLPKITGQVPGESIASWVDRCVTCLLMRQAEGGVGPDAVMSARADTLQVANVLRWLSEDEPDGHWIRPADMALNWSVSTDAVVVALNGLTRAGKAERMEVDECRICGTLLFDEDPDEGGECTSCGRVTDRVGVTVYRTKHEGIPDKTGWDSLVDELGFKRVIPMTNRRVMCVVAYPAGQSWSDREEIRVREKLWEDCHSLPYYRGQVKVTDSWVLGEDAVFNGRRLEAGTWVQNLEVTDDRLWADVSKESGTGCGEDELVTASHVRDSAGEMVGTVSGRLRGVDVDSRVLDKDEVVDGEVRKVGTLDGLIGDLNGATGDMTGRRVRSVYLPDGVLGRALTGGEGLVGGLPPGTTVVDVTRSATSCGAWVTVECREFEVVTQHVPVCLFEVVGRRGSLLEGDDQTGEPTGDGGGSSELVRVAREGEGEEPTGEGAQKTKIQVVKDPRNASEVFARFADALLRDLDESFVVLVPERGRCHRLVGVWRGRSVVLEGTGDTQATLALGDADTRVLKREDNGELFATWARLFVRWLERGDPVPDTTAGPVFGVLDRGAWKRGEVTAVDSVILAGLLALGDELTQVVPGELPARKDWLAATARFWHHPVDCAISTYQTRCACDPEEAGCPSCDPETHQQYCVRCDPMVSNIKYVDPGHQRKLGANWEGRPGYLA